MRSKFIFGHPKWGGGGGSSQWPACKTFGDIHSICPWANTPILVIISNLFIIFYDILHARYAGNIGNFIILLHVIPVYICLYTHRLCAYTNTWHQRAFLADMRIFNDGGFNSVPVNLMVERRTAVRNI